MIKKQNLGWVLGAIIIIVLNLFFYNISWAGMGFLVFTLLLHAYIWATHRQAQNNFWGAGASLMAVILALGVTWRSNWSLISLSMLTSFYGTALTVYFLNKPEKVKLTLPKLVLFPLEILQGWLSPVKKELDGKGELETKKTTKLKVVTESIKKVDRGLWQAIGQGLLFAAPLLLVLLMVLIKADPIFGQMLAFENWRVNFGDMIGRFFFSLFYVFVLVCIGAIYLKPDRNRVTIINQGLLAQKKYQGVEELIVVGSIVVLFLVFLIFQFRFLFWGVSESDLLHLGLSFKTYAEYTRQGFTQLLLAASIVIGVLMFVLSRKIEASRVKKWLAGLNAILVIETFVLLASAAKRWQLYFDDHGLTMTRVLGLTFLFWLVGWLMTLLIQNYKRKWESLSTGVFLSYSFLLLMTLLVINPDYLIATKYPPTVNEQIDYRFMSYAISHDGDIYLAATLEKMEAEWAELQATSYINEDGTGHCSDTFTTEAALNSVHHLWVTSTRLQLRYLPLDEAKVWQAKLWEFHGKPLNYSLDDLVEKQRRWPNFHLGEYLAFKKYHQGDFYERLTKLDQEFELFKRGGWGCRVQNENKNSVDENVNENESTQSANPVYESPQ